MWSQFSRKIFTSTTCKMLSSVTNQVNNIQLQNRPAIYNLSKYDTSVEECMPCFHELVKELTTTNDTEMKCFMERYKEVLEYNVGKGKNRRVRAMVTAYKILACKESLTSENLRLANILGWCVELFNAAILVADDIMDASTHRRSSPCWYLVPEVGMEAINDAFLLENSVYTVLKKHFVNLKCYLQIIELFHFMSKATVIGQSLDRGQRIPKDKICNLNLYSAERYYTITKFKTHYYTNEVPVRLVLCLAGKFDHEIYKPHFQILLEMSIFFQQQNDFLDCFGNFKMTGKEGSDIQEGKCTWLIITALQRANRFQRKILQENYGKNDEESVARVRHLYEELEIPQAYYTLENNISNKIQKRIKKVSNLLPYTFFDKMMEMSCKKVSCYKD